MVVVTGIRLPLTANPEDAACRQVMRDLGLGRSDVQSVRLRRMSPDARHGRLSMVCSVVLECKDAETERQLCRERRDVMPFEQVELVPEIGNQPLKTRPVVIGFGPAGLFCACLLAEYGFRPLVLERGAQVEERARAVERFWQDGTLDPSVNVQFGEGGAGTFSDGKLVTRTNDPLGDYVLAKLVEFGAPADILYRAKPHIGTDMLRDVVRRMREHVITLGGEVRFHAAVTDLAKAADGGWCVTVADGDRIRADVVVLACGHSARDTFFMLKDRGLPLEAKPFSVGVRIEHPQSLINQGLYGKNADNPLLPPGEYALSQKLTNRTVYTFCMCPGGQVVAAASEEGGVVTNGMSHYRRDGQNANAAVVVSVSPDDFGGDPFRAIAFQRKLEQTAFIAAGGDYRAPAQNVGSFLNGGKASLLDTIVTPSYRPGVVCTPLGDIFGDEITNCLRDGIRVFDRKIRGFASPGAVLTAPETRTSSPLRIRRTESREAEGFPGVYPTGEGPGYAGGIMSAAVDGLRTALAILERYQP